MRVYDPATADGRFHLQLLGIRWGLVALYAILAAAGVIQVDVGWFAASEGLLVGFHVYYTWYVWRDLHGAPLPAIAAYATPFMDTLAVSLALVAVGDPLYPIWAVYFFVVVGVAFFYYQIERAYVVWLLGCYAFVGMALQLRGLYVPVREMGVAAIVLLAGMLNLAAYTGGERRLRRQISDVAHTDPLTNLLNRRGLEEALADRLRTSTPDQTIAVFMVDVDHFKRVNDQFGHLAADGVLEQLAEQLAASARAVDLVARYGGDEFVMIIPEVTPDDALAMAERLRQQVARLGLCTVSIGVSTSQDRNDARALIDEADAALLRAKQAGRNCVRGSTDARLNAA